MYHKYAIAKYTAKQVVFVRRDVRVKSQISRVCLV